jgi:hypothetical protein
MIRIREFKQTVRDSELFFVNLDPGISEGEAKKLAEEIIHRFVGMKLHRISMNDFGGYGIEFEVHSQFNYNDAADMIKREFGPKIQSINWSK